MKNLFLGLAILILLSVTGCKLSSKKNIPANAVSQPIEMPLFNADSAYHFVKAQTDFGPRVPNTKAHQDAALYLEQKLQAYCNETRVQKFQAKAYNGTVLNGKNIIGIINPEAEQRILLAAHWDSRHRADNDPNPENWDKPIDGANDGASGVGVLLEVARQLQLKKPEIGVDIIFFDAEDYGEPQNERTGGDWWCLGSQYWAKNPHRKDFMYGILLDMVGDVNAQFFMEGFSSQYAPAVLSKVWSHAYRLGHKDYFRNINSSHIIDDHYYVNKIAGIPMINIVHQDMTTRTGFSPRWHTLNDHIGSIDRNTLYVVGTTLLETIYNP